MKYFEMQDSIYTLVKKYPEVKDYLISKGMNQLEDEKNLENLGKQLSIEMLIFSKNYDKGIFIKELEDYIVRYRETADSSLEAKVEQGEKDIFIQGVLPCPVRIPLLEGFEAWLAQQEKSYQDRIRYELQAASMGVDWIKERIAKATKEDELADLFLSAGFDLFFDQRYMGHFKRDKVFQDLIPYKSYHHDFQNDEIQMKDPDGDYSVIGAVPAVFLLNQKELGEDKGPETWEELLSGNYENAVSLPVGDFDLFNAILLNIYVRFGIDGVKRLGKTLMKSMHPSEMVKSGQRENQPKVTIMPYFFTKMVREGGAMRAVWPKDGAIISPIFLLCKRSKAEQIQPVVDFLSSKAVGEILSHNGRFPSMHPEVDNRIPKEWKYMWLGWDFIRNNDLGRIIQECMDAFEGGKE